MLLYTGYWLAGDFIPEELEDYCDITLDPDQQATSYEKNRANMLLYNTGSRSAGVFIPDEPGQHAVI